MTDLQDLAAALRARLEVVGDRAFFERDPQGHLAKLVAASTALNAVAARLPADVDPMLRHYLERQSYVKALDWLDAQPA
jgi:hypothetical protein